MVDKIEATDPQTVVFRLKFATAAFLPALADPYAHIRGLGLKGMRVWDFGWQSTAKGGGQGKRGHPIAVACDRPGCARAAARRSGIKRLRAYPYSNEPVSRSARDTRRGL